VANKHQNVPQYDRDEQKGNRDDMENHGFFILPEVFLCNVALTAIYLYNSMKHHTERTDDEQDHKRLCQAVPLDIV
jgi:hypothetical protein